MFKNGQICECFSFDLKRDKVLTKNFLGKKYSYKENILFKHNTEILNNLQAAGDVCDRSEVIQFILLSQ